MAGRRPVRYDGAVHRTMQRSTRSVPARAEVVVILAVAAATFGCRSANKPGAGAAPEQAAAAEPDPATVAALCTISHRALLGLSECVAEPEDRPLLERVRAAGPDDLQRQAPTNPPDARMTAHRCGNQLAEWMTLAGVAGCQVGLSAAERAALAAQVGRRTGPPADASDEQRRFLGRLAGLRDRTCACTTLACAMALEPEIATVVEDEGAGGGREFDRAAAGDIYDELSACRRHTSLADLARDVVGPAGRSVVATFLRPYWRVAAERMPKPAPVHDDSPPGGITSLALPDGATLRWDDVRRMTDASARISAVGLFEDVAECRALRPADEVAACERDAFDTYAEAIAVEPDEE